jgi:hypothetical protein
MSPPRPGAVALPHGHGPRGLRGLAKPGQQGEHLLRPDALRQHQCRTGQGLADRREHCAPAYGHDYPDRQAAALAASLLRIRLPVQMRPDGEADGRSRRSADPAD